jgi:prepilin signal peptidase PulO-like enzyme (type II secretory pathway)
MARGAFHLSRIPAGETRIGSSPLNTMLAAVAQPWLLDGALLAACIVMTRRYGLRWRANAAPAALALLAGYVAQMAYAATHAFGLASLAVLIALACVTVSAASDIATGYVFDAVTIPSTVSIAALATAAHSALGAVAGGLTAGGALFFLYAVTRGRGLGLGDVKLACCIGAALGAYAALCALWLAFVLGGICAVALVLGGRRNRSDALCFAPFLAAGMTTLAFRGAAL